MELPVVNLKGRFLLPKGASGLREQEEYDHPGSLAVDNLGLPDVLRLVCLGQLHHPGHGCVGRRSARFHRRHKHVSGWTGGHHLPGHRPHKYLLPAAQRHGHEALRCRHGHPQPAPQAVLLLPGLPHVQGAWGHAPAPHRHPRAFTGSQCLPDD